MPHISENDLHAWLDGAIPEGSEEHQTLKRHLESCPECASRLDEAREVKNEAGRILASALPRGSAPPFEHINRLAGDDPEDSSIPISRFARLRRGWFSAQRLGWAATVMLALGAGWIGRAVLVERGWSDPFHEGSEKAASTAAVRESDVEAPEELFSRDMDVLEERGNESRQRKDQRTESDGSASDAEGKSGEDRPVRKKEAPEVSERAAPVSPDAAASGRVGALTQEGRTESPAAEDLAVVDGVRVSPGGRVRKEPEARAIQAPLGPWHDLPPERLDPAAESAPGCYRLEYSWSPGVGYLPGTIELKSTPAITRADQSIREVAVSGDAAMQLHEAIWAMPAADSVWVRLVTGSERDIFTVRAGQTGRDWLGEGRVLSPAAPVSAGQNRGTVRLTRVSCVP